MSMDYWEIIKEYPPCLVRLLARETKGGKQIRAISDNEISLKSGLTVRQVQKIYSQINWDEITVSEMRSFIRGCQFDPFNSVMRNRVAAYRRQRGSKFQYLRKSPWWETVFKPLILMMKRNEI